MKISSGFLLCIALGLVQIAIAQTNYEINIATPEREIVRGHLDLGGVNPRGEQITVNNFYISKSDKPIFPIVGEFHFSRYPAQYWDEAIMKMKAGGINVIASYVFWNIHERTEGEFDWSGNLNLRRFAELCAKNDIDFIVRLGPFCHGEIRNGGIPDWLYGRTFEIRSNDPEYLMYVDRLYGEIAQQCKGLLYKDGGPIVGVQLENEFQHSAAPWEVTPTGAKKEYTVAERNAAVTHEQISPTDGINPHAQEGKEHMQILKQLAKNHGMDVPLYTATGWGNAAIVELGSIPVTSCYVYPFWQDPEPSPFYLFKDIHGFPDYLPVSYDPTSYPSIAAEIGPGIQVKYSRRPVVNPAFIKPLMVRTIGSGSNGIGYYMYHGGSTPVFDGKFYNEEANGIPKINYDFQAPLGQYGQARPHFHSLKTLHMFLDAFGDQLAPMKTVLPPGNEKITTDDAQTLRYAVRSQGVQGFLFMLNFQDHLDYNDVKAVSVQVQHLDDAIRFPTSGSFDLLQEKSAILPFNLTVGNSLIKSATVQPLTTLQQGNDRHFVFFSIDGLTPEILLGGKVEVEELHNGKVVDLEGNTLVRFEQKKIGSFRIGNDNFLIVPEAMALQANKIGEQLIFADGVLLDESNQVSLVTTEMESKLSIYPAIQALPRVTNASVVDAKSTDKVISSFTLTFPRFTPPVTITKISDRKFTIKLTHDMGTVHDVYLDIDYIGDRGMAYIDGILETDHFYHEKKWELSLREIWPKLLEKEMVLIFQPLYENQECLIDFKNPPKFVDGKYLEIGNIRAVNEYKAILVF